MKLLALINGIHEKTPEQVATDRELKVLRSRLNTEAIGLKRAAIMARTQLVEEILKRPERPDDHHSH